jgi:hypothetical protein
VLIKAKIYLLAGATELFFNAEKRKKKEQKIQKPRCFEYICGIGILNLHNLFDDL